jgi:predicted SnoaL-like aldol condensation-catalyzing enzyme
VFLEDFMSELTEKNKSIVRGWNDLAFVQHKPEAAVAMYLGSYYRQHNPQAADGPEAFIAFVQRFTGAFPNFRLDVKRVVAEGDLVVMHSHLVREPGDRGVAVVDIFRLEQGKIVEHWDVLQDILEKAANTNSMF